MAARLPEVTRRLALVQAPQSRNVPSISAADAAAPLTMLARQLSLFGDTAASVAKAAAPEAAKQSVTRDDAGNITVQRLPVVGEAAPIYQRAVKLATVADAEIGINGDISKMRQQFKADPESFEKAVGTYRDKKIAQYNESGGPDVGAAIAAIINRAGTWNLRGLSIEKTKADQKAATSRLKVSADEKADDLVAMMGGGSTASPDFASVQSDYATVLDEAAGNGMVSFTAEDAARHRDATARRGREAAIVGAARAAYAEGGIERLAELRPQLEAVAAPEERDTLTRRVAFDVGAQQAADEDEARSTLRAEIAENQSRLSHGVAQMVSGSVDQSWLDRNAYRIGQGNYETMRLASLGPQAAGDEPEAAGRLLDLALTDRLGAEQEALAAYASGLITMATMASSVLLAAQVAQDEAARPWANTLRRSVAAQTKDMGAGALGEFSQWLASAEAASPAEAKEAADAIVDRHTDIDRRRLATTLPLPYGVASRPTKPDQIEAVRATLAKGAADGSLTLADIASQAGLLADWRRALKAEA